MKTVLFNQLGEKIGVVELPDAIFNVPINPDLVHQAVLTQKANTRHPLAHAKGRSEVRGGGKKPWRQKGTGRARHGSIRSPIWVGGGVTHGPTKEKVYSKKINKKARQLALFMVLSSKVQDRQIAVLDSISLDRAKTKKMKGILEKISNIFEGYRKNKKKQDSILLVYPPTITSEGLKNKSQDSRSFGVGVKPDSNKDLVRSIRNLSFAKILRADSLNVLDTLENKYLILLKEAIPVIEKTYLK